MTLLELAKKSIIEAMEGNEFELHDFSYFGDIANLINKIDEKEFKPYLITWRINMWEGHCNFLYNAMELLGYEFIGNMDMSDDEYKFECEDVFYDKLFKFTGRKTDYSNHMNIDDLKIIE